MTTIVNVKASAKATKLQSAIVNAIEIRLPLHEANTNAECKTLRSDLKAFASTSGLAMIDLCIKKGLKLDGLVNFACNDKTDSKFIAVKVITKIRQLLTAVAQNNARKLDGYTFSIVRNLLTNKSLTVFECERCLSTKIVNDGTDIFKLDESKTIKAYKNTAPSTAETQSSSTRMMLMLLDVCHVEKGKKDDAISFKDSEHASIFLNMLNIEDDSLASA